MSARVVLWLVILFLLVLPLQAAAQPAAETQAFDPDPLRPADISSPRDTLSSFNTSVTTTYRAFLSGAPEDVIQKLMRRVHETLDFSQLAKRAQVASKTETVLALKEILDRIELPPEEAIPGKEEVADKDNPITSWTIPKTSITIAKVEEGPHAGEFLFAAETVDRLDEFYQDAKHLPYKPGALVGIYEGHKHRPGRMVPRSLAAALPIWSKTVVFEQALWQWLGLAIVGIAAFLIVLRLLRWGKRWDERHRNAEAFMRFGLPLGVLAGIGIVFACRYVLIFVFRLLSDLGDLLSFVVWVLIFAGIGWLIVLMTSRIAEAVNEARKVKKGSIDAQLVSVLLRLFSLVGLVLLVIYAADFFGVPLTPVVASLGIGGLAIALAVRPTLENVIGGLTLFADRPVRVGDFCLYGGQIGTVEAIGLRSTRVRSLERTIVTIPNAEFSQMQLDNFQVRDMRLLLTVLKLRYETTADQLRYVLAELRTMLLGHPMVTPEPARVRFIGYGPYSKDLEIFAYLRCQDQDEFLAIQEDLLLRIEDIVKEAGTGFAFTSQRAYLGRDTGLDAERGREAETKVEEWRSRGQLPFPEFDEGLRWEKEDILDYPPPGSPGYEPRKGLSDTEPETEPEPQAPPPSEPKRPGWRFGSGGKRR